MKTTLKEAMPNIAKQLGFKPGTTIGWVNGHRPTGKWRSFDKGGLPALVFKRCDADPNLVETRLMYIQGETHYGTNKHVEGTLLRAVLPYLDKNEDKIKVKAWKLNNAKTVDEAKEVIVNKLLALPEVREIIRASFPTAMADNEIT